MVSVNQIIDALGGTSKVATALGLTPSTVHSWRTANFIPTWRQPRLMELALTLNVPLSATDFPSTEQRVSRVA